jgi:glycine oxidase
VKIAIAGGGVVGCAVAYELASRGALVEIIDPRGIGRGATHASAGVLAPHVEGHFEPLLRLAVCALEHYDAFVARVSRDARQPIEYRRTGTLQAGRGEREVRQLQEGARRLRAGRVQHTWLSGDGARELEPALSADVSAALLVPHHGYVAVPMLMAALEAALSHHNVARSAARVERIDATGQGIQLTTHERSVSAEAVVIAAGSWSGGVSMAGTLSDAVRPIRGQLLHVRCPEPPVSRVIWGTSAYLVPWQDGSLLVGATTEDVGFDESATVAGVRDLIAGAAGIVPAIHAARFEEVRVGLRPRSGDELPLIGASSTMRSVYYATGHYRNGVLMAPLTAALVADLVLEGRERPELALTRPDRFGL